MIRKLVFSFILVGIIGFVQAQLLNNVSIDGKIINPKSQEVYLAKIGGQAAIPLDTTKLDAAQNFHFDLMVDKPGFYQISQGGNNFSMIILSPNDRMQIKLNGNNLRNTISVSGSWETEQLLKITNKVNTYDAKKQDLEEQYKKVYGTAAQDSVGQILAKEYEITEMNKSAYLKSALLSDPSLSGLIFMNVLKIPDNMDFYEKYAPAMKKKYPDNIFVNSMYQQYMSEKGKVKLSPGMPAPEISLPTPDGSIFKLSSLKGSVVLIDFWASWCSPCRRANPHAVSLYKKYHEKGFDILGVSLDKTKESWVKAIKDDGLVWHQVSDLKYWQSEAGRAYGVQSIPHTVLVDREGKIIAVGLRGAALEAKLKEIFGF